MRVQPSTPIQVYLTSKDSTKRSFQHALNQRGVLFMSDMYGARFAADPLQEKNGELNFPPVFVLFPPPTRDPSTFSEGTWTLQTYTTVSPITF